MYFDDEKKQGDKNQAEEQQGLDSPIEDGSKPSAGESSEAAGDANVGSDAESHDGIDTSISDPMETDFGDTENANTMDASGLDGGSSSATEAGSNSADSGIPDAPPMDTSGIDSESDSTESSIPTSDPAAEADANTSLAAQTGYTDASPNEALDDTSMPSQEDMTAEASEDQSPGTYSAVSLAANKRKFLIIGILIASIIVIYLVFSSAGKSGKENEAAAPKLSSTQVERAISGSTPVTRDIDSDQSASSIVRTQLPEFSQLEAPEPPAPPPPPAPDIPQTTLLPGGPTSPTAPNFNTGSSIFEGKSEESSEALLAKRGESIMVLGGASSTGFGSDKEGEEGEAKKKDNSGFLGFGNGQLDGDTFSKTSATQVKATKVGNMKNLIAQGKMISAVLETAINTDIPGTLRAIVSRDVYSESGKRVLVPKGSRLIGEYEPEVKNGQTRIPIVWNRVILPNGFDVALSSPGVDGLGRAGVAGKLNNKFWTRLTSAFLVSFILPYAAFKLSDVGTSDTTNSTSTGTDGTVTTTSTGDTESQLVADSAKKFSDIATEIVQSNFSETPTITIDQGTLVKVFVNKDLIFPTQEYMNRHNYR